MTLCEGGFALDAAPVGQETVTGKTWCAWQGRVSSHVTLRQSVMSQWAPGGSVSHSSSRLSMTLDLILVGEPEEFPPL